jgi:NAD(P)-dependent dehydrogenase (short-subunit alcohol dehydrogenase family)
VGVLEGKVALVTGGSRGVGAAIAKSLAREGAAVVVNYLKSEEKAAEVARSIRGENGKAIPYGADITDEEAVRRMVRTTAETFGPVDILVNNALPDYRFDPAGRKDFGSIGWEDYAQQLGGLKGALHCSQAVVPGMIGRGGLVKVYPEVPAAVRVGQAADGVGRPAERLGCGKGAVQGVNATVVDVEGDMVAQATRADQWNADGICASEMGVEIVPRWWTMHQVVLVPSAGAQHPSVAGRVMQQVELHECVKRVHRCLHTRPYASRRDGVRA